MTSINTLLTVAATVLFASQLALATPVCQAFQLATNCPYGSVLDINGCNTCACNSLCENTTLTCPPKNKFSAKKTEQNSSCNVAYSFGCIVCQDLKCNNTCPWGYRTDENQCDTCECYNPCDNTTVECNVYFTLQPTPYQLNLAIANKYECVCMDMPEIVAVATALAAANAAAAIAKGIADAASAAAASAAYIAAGVAAAAKAQACGH